MEAGRQREMEDPGEAGKDTSIARALTLSVAYKPESSETFFFFFFFFFETKFNVYTAINQYHIVNRNTPTASIHKID